MSYTLINFNIPNHLKKNFDHLVYFKRVSRTSILNSMIEEFCRREFKLIKEDGRLNDLILDIEQKNPPHINNTIHQVGKNHTMNHSTYQYQRTSLIHTIMDCDYDDV